MPKGTKPYTAGSKKDNEKPKMSGAGRSPERFPDKAPGGKGKNSLGFAGRKSVTGLGSAPKDPLEN